MKNVVKILFAMSVWFCSAFFATSAPVVAAEMSNPEP